MAKAKKLPSGSWRVRVFDGYDAKGKSIYQSFTADTPEEAEYLASEYKYKRKRTDKPKNMTVGEAIDRYIESKDTVLSPATVREYKQERRNNLQGLMNVKLNNLTQELIQREINLESKNHSPKTIRNMHGLLSAALKMYYPEFILETTLPQKEKFDIQMLTEDEMKSVLNHVANSEMELPVLFSMCLGLRRSEICGLTWDCVNLNKRIIIIRKAQVRNDNREWVIKKTKNYTSNRTVTLNNVLYNKLSEEKDKTGFIIKLRPDIITQRFERIIKHLGLPRFRFHDLRHYNASIMLALGIPDKYAMKRMGHATNNMLKTVYQHTLENEEEKINAIVDEYFDNLIKDN